LVLAKSDNCNTCVIIIIVIIYICCGAAQPKLTTPHSNQFKVTACSENPEMSGNSTPVGEIWPKVREVLGKILSGITVCC